jgi:hypothetical protein
MSERASYSRVYWSIVDDSKFVNVYDSDANLAAWLRLLLIADQAHPASAHLPSNVRRAAVTALAEAELIDLLPGSRYRVHGLDAERERRRIAATSRGPKGFGPDTGPRPSGYHSGTERSPNGPGTTGLSRGRDETSQDEPNARATNDPWDAPEMEAMQWLARHGCDVRPGNGYHQKLITAVERHGINAVVGALDRMAQAGVPNGDVKGLLFGAIDMLDKQARPSLVALEKEDRAADDRAARQRRLDATQVRLHETGGHELEPSRACPRCKEMAG